MDIHDFGSEISVADVAQAHRWDREVERRRLVRFRGCWVDQRAGRVFCLVEAPDAAAAAAVHRDSHGLVAHEVHEVQETCPSQGQQEGGVVPEGCDEPSHHVRG